MSTTCKYCNEPENKQEKPGLICESCISFVHLACLRRPGTPGDFTCDVFFDFTCEDCTPDKKEVFIRNKFPWVNVILLTLHHLSTQSYGISNHGFFHYKTHICSFIDRYWHLLFDVHFKQKKNWIGTIAGALSVYNNIFFHSGSVILGETGWWKLLHAFSPAVAAQIIQELARYKPKGGGRLRNQMALDKTIFIMKVTEMGYKDLIHQEIDNTPILVPEPVLKRRRIDWDEVNPPSNSSYYDQFDSDSRNEPLDENILEDQQTSTALKENSFSDVESTFRGFDFPSIKHEPSDSSSVHSLQHSDTLHTQLYYDSDSHSSFAYPQDHSDGEEKKKQEKPKKQEEKQIVRRESLFSTQLNSIDLPWVEKMPKSNKDLIEMSQYEEIQLLKKVEGLISRVKDPNKKADLHRLRAKLSLRRLKRHKHLPLFDLDTTVKLLGGFITEDHKIMNNERILDRFQRSYLIDNLCGTISSAPSGIALVASVEASPFRSLYSGTTLKPYIRRDTTKEPLWLKLMDELLIKANKGVPDYRPPPRASLDYSYVRPHHVAAVNALCAQFFWPGIDLTEALEYPEFSCVVTYKRVVVACAFLVPDVRHNEAYISFVLTRPEWRNAHIATFMLYHLLQTCTGKDVTLHVSPTNPAIFLYQKFGFKVEELIQDFYEKYFDIDYKGCRHALFLRLVR